MAIKPFVAMALLLAACAPEFAAVPTTSANVPNAWREPRPRFEEAQPARVDTLQVTSAGAAPPTSEVHEAPAEAKRPSSSAYLVLGAILLLPFLTMPSANGALSPYYTLPAPTFAPASNLPSGELPSTVEIVSTVSPEPIVTTPQIITTPPTIATPQTSTTVRTVFGVPLGKAWTP